MQHALDEPRLKELCGCYNVSNRLLGPLRVLLLHYKLCVLVDDSGSMRYESLRTGETAWSETRRFVCALTALTSSHSGRALDLWFLNRARRPFVQTVGDAEAAFDELPCGGLTRLDRALQYMLAEPYDQQRYKGRVLILCSDGKPYDELHTVVHLLEHERRLTDYVTFMAHHTSDSNSNRSQRQLRALDTRLARFAVMWSHDEEQEHTDCDNTLSYGDYVVQATMLPITPSLRVYERLQPVKHLVEAPDHRQRTCTLF